MDRTFQVDLRGVVDLLSHHLYASPRVYVRELLQNAVDAITARRATEPRRPALVRDRAARADRRRHAAGARHRHRADRGAGARAAGHHRPQLQAGRAGLRPARVPRPVRHRAAVLLPGRRRDPGASPGPAGEPTVLWTGLRRRPLRGRAAAEQRGPSRAPRSPWCRGAAPSSGSPPRPSPSWPGSTARCCRSRVRVGDAVVTAGAPPWRPRRTRGRRRCSRVRPGSVSASTRSTSSTATCRRPG